MAALRGGLAGLGVRPGDRIALVAGNHRSFVQAYLAVLGLGAVAVPLNPASPAAELAREVGAVRPTVAIIGPGAAATADAFPRSTTIVSVDPVPGQSGQVASTAAGVVAFADLLAATPAPEIDREDGDLAVLLFTSGTAGSPKAAMLTHGNLRSNLEQLQAAPGRVVRPDDVGLGILPMFHIFGLNVSLGLTLYAGASLVLVPGRFDPATTLALVAEHRVTLVASAPPLFAAWAALDVAASALNTVRLASSGAAPLSEEVAGAFRDRFGIDLRQGYGLTEAAPVVTTSRLDRPASTATVGVPLPGVLVRLVDSSGEDALVGDEGEIWVKGPNVFAGYWEDRDATAAVLTPDGWLRTGDVAVVGDDGELRLVDRAKDLIIVSGFNVFPAEVEEVLLALEGVAEAAVVGVRDPKTGEAVKAFVVRDANPAGAAVSEGDVKGWAASELARYKCPTEVAFVDELPHGMGGKLLRRQLR